MSVMFGKFVNSPFQKLIPFPGLGTRKSIFATVHAQSLSNFESTLVTSCLSAKRKPQPSYLLSSPTKVEISFYGLLLPLHLLRLPVIILWIWSHVTNSVTNRIDHLSGVCAIFANEKPTTNISSSRTDRSNATE
jgi:hypothetical protein